MSDRSNFCYIFFTILIIFVFHQNVSSIDLPVQVDSVYSVPALFGQQSISDINSLIVETVPRGACSEVSNTSANGLSIIGKIALIYGDAHCLLMQKALNAQAAGAIAVLVYSCSPEDFCDPAASVMLGLAGQVYSIPSLMISYYDGLKITNWIASNESVTASIYGAGSSTDSNDRAAFKSFYQIMKENNGGQQLPLNGIGSSFDISGALADWEMLMTDSYDPCTTRMYGIFCKNSRIVWINCYGCGLLGNLPASIGLLNGLLEVDFSIGNVLTGSLPCSLSNITDLTLLNLASNSFSMVDDCIGQLKNLKTLDLSSNSITSIPDSFINLINLKVLNLRYNSITTIPVLNGLSNLTSIDISINLIIADFGLWDFSTLPNLVKIDFHSNKFYGSLYSTQFNGLNLLTYLDVSKNSIVGALPAMSNCLNLVNLNMGFNKINGTIPNYWSTLLALKKVYLSHNEIVSPVLAFVSIALEEIDLILTSYMGDSSLDGDAGAVFTLGFGQGLKVLNFANNKLAGGWGSGWFYFLWPNLLSFSIANNQIGGPLPSDIWQISSAQISNFDFSGNLFVGSIPVGSPSHSMRISFANNPFLSNVGSTNIPSFLIASSVVILDSSSQFACPVLVSSDSTINIDFSIDPIYYQYSLCDCQRGYTYSGLPPNCTSFPSKIVLSSNKNDIFTDGSSSGRLRSGVDTSWSISPPGNILSIVINVIIHINQFNPSALGDNAASYILTVTDGALNTIYYFSTDGYPASNVPLDVSILVLSNTANIHFLSNSQKGPIFEASYNASISCPSQYAYDLTILRCVKIPADVALNESEKLSILLVCSLLVIVSICFGFYMYANLENRVIHSASPAFCFLFLFGGIILLLSVILRCFEYSIFNCTFHTVLLNVGFSIAYGSLFAKTWRLHKIFNNKELAMTKITNFQLFTILAIWVFFDIIILICWLSVSPYYLDPIGNYCESKQGDLFTIIILVIRAVQVFAGSYLTYEVRGLPSQFNESKFLAISIYNVITLSVLYLAVVLSFSNTLSKAAQLVFESVIVTAGSFSTLCVVLFPKFYAIMSDPSLDKGVRKSLLGPQRKSFHGGAENNGDVVKFSPPSSPSHNSNSGVKPADAIRDLENVIKVKNEAMKGLKAKAKVNEENLRKVNDSIEEEELKLAEVYAEIEYLKDIVEDSSKSSSSVAPTIVGSQMQYVKYGVDNPQAKYSVSPQNDLNVENV